MMKHKGCSASTVGFYLMVVGGLNWGLTGLGHFASANLNLVNVIFGGMPSVEYGIYLLVGLATIMSLVGCKCATCKASCGEAATCSHAEGCSCGDCARCTAKK